MAEIKPLWLRIPPRPSDDVIRQNAEIGRLHADWVRAHADETPFQPEGRTEGSDYPLHYVDLEASGEALDDFHGQVRRVLNQP